MFERALMFKLELDVSKDFDRAWHFCKSFGFKLQASNKSDLSIELFSISPDCKIIHTIISDRENLLSFFKTPLPFLLKAVQKNGLTIAKVNTFEGSISSLHDLTPEHNFFIEYRGNKGSTYHLNQLLEGDVCYRIAWGLCVLQNGYDKDRDFDTCFEMGDGQLVSASIDYIRLRGSKPTKMNIDNAIIACSQNSLLAS